MERVGKSNLCLSWLREERKHPSRRSVKAGEMEWRSHDPVNSAPSQDVNKRLNPASINTVTHRDSCRLDWESL